jgi:hypothetical protein
MVFSMAVTVRSWKRDNGVASDALEIVEGFKAVAAAPLRLAGGGAELADAFEIGRAAAGATLRAAGGLGRRDAVFLQPRAALLAQPVGGPGRRELRVSSRSASMPRARSAASISIEISAVAGQPE